MNNPIRSLMRLMPHPLGKPTLRQRRRNRLLRHATVSALVGLAIFAALQSAAFFVATQPIIVAKHAIARGRPIAQADIELHKVTSNRPFSHAAASSVDVVERIALVDIASGEPVLPSMIAPAPSVPDDYTIIDVTLYGGETDVLTGMKVSLVAATEQSCPVSHSTGQSAQTPNQQPADSSLCVLADAAIAMPATNDGPASDDASSTNDTASTNHRRFAMRQDEAARVMQIQSLGDILAVVNRAR